MGNLEPLIFRRRDSARVLNVSESQILKWERAGWLTPIKYPGIRAAGHDPAEVRALARQIINREVTA